MAKRPSNQPDRAASTENPITIPAERRRHLQVVLLASGATAEVREFIWWNAEGKKCPPFRVGVDSDAESLRAFAIGLLCLEHCRQLPPGQRAVDEGELGDVTAVRSEAGWRLEGPALPPETAHWLQILGNSFEKKFEKKSGKKSAIDEAKPGPLGQLISACPGIWLDGQERPRWKAARSKLTKKTRSQPYFWCRDAQAEFAGAGPTLEFLLEGDPRSVADSRSLLGLARALERGMHSWKQTLARRPHFPDYGKWLSNVVTDCDKLQLRGVNVDKVKCLPLASVFIDLDTRATRPSDPVSEGKGAEMRKPVTAWEALFELGTPRTVLTGHPGSGKSTFVQYVTLLLAEQCLTEEATLAALARAGVGAPPVLPPRPLLPFRIVMRELASYQAERADAKTVDVPDRDKPVVEAFLRKKLRDGSHDEALKALAGNLRAGRALLLFDGLDEVPPGQLDAAVAAIKTFCEGEFQACRVVVTCRVISYDAMIKRERALAGFPPPVEISSLSITLRDRFIVSWYQALHSAGALNEQEARGCSLSLRRATDDQQLALMAENPFFLTAMAALHGPTEQLPRNSAALMDRLVEGVLQETRKRSPGTAGESEKSALEVLLLSINSNVETLRKRLEKVAYKSREKRSELKSRFVDGDVLNASLWFGKGHPDGWPEPLLELLRHRAGLLHSEDGENFEYAYRFEEFLAGCYLSRDDNWDKGPPFPNRAVTLFRAQPEYSRQVVIWAAGFRVHVLKSLSPVRELVSRLLQPGKERSISLVDLELAAEIARDSGMTTWQNDDVTDVEETVGRLRRELEKVRDDFDKARRSFQHAPADRARAAAAIGHLGDERPGIGRAGPLFQWCGAQGLVVAAASKAGGEAKPADIAARAFPSQPGFLLGEPKEREDRAPNSFVQQPCDRVRWPFFISRYPVTVAQYQLFIEAGGYEREFLDEETKQHRLWSEAGWRWRTTGHVSGEEQWKGELDWIRGDTYPVTRPRRLGVQYDVPNSPQIGISWFEAQAYARWLDSPEMRPRVLAELGMPKADWRIRLPTEPEWELVARWDVGQQRVDDRRYPWGDDGTESELNRRCNWEKSGIGRTSAVGLFQVPGEPSGPADLSGNVWEWCQSKWVDSADPRAFTSPSRSLSSLDEGDGEDLRVLRGGSWIDDDPTRLRATVRNCDHPADRISNVGFRCVVVGGGFWPG